MGTFAVFTIEKLFSTPRPKAGMFFPGTCLDQQTVLWSPSECLWYLAMLTAGVFSAAMTACVNGGSHPKSVLLDASVVPQSLVVSHVMSALLHGFILPLSIPAECEPSQLLGWVTWLGCHLHLAQAVSLARLSSSERGADPKATQQHPSSLNFEKNNELMSCASDQACAQYAPKLKC